ncbi:MAG TPA: phage virion morphogenesis protein [Prosthecobacter sp.]
MKISINKVRDVLTPDLRSRISKAAAPKRALEAMGTTVVSMTKRAFGQPSLRPASWPALKPATLKAKKAKGYGSQPLRASGTLSMSPRVVTVTAKTVTVGSDRKVGTHSLAAIHQQGTKDGRIPARPFFPFDKSGNITERGKRNVLAAAKAALDSELPR